MLRAGGALFAECMVHSAFSCSQFTAPTLIVPFRSSASCCHVGLSCWQWPHLTQSRAERTRRSKGRHVVSKQHAFKAKTEGSSQ